MTHDAIAIDTLTQDLATALATVTRADHGPFAGDGHAQHGDHPAAHALWCAVTKGTRHAQRMHATLAAARLTAATWGLAPTPASTALALLADRIGVGGTAGLGGSDAGTTRIGAFTRLGKGRKQASDGPAWIFALRLALAHVAPFGGFLCDGPDDDGIVLAVFPHQDGTHDPDWRPDWYDDRDDAWWVRIPAQLDLFALVGRHVLAAVGIAWDADHDDGCDPLRSPFPLHVGVTTPARCAHLLDACRRADPAPTPASAASADW
jgi:hypothetical protein